MQALVLSVFMGPNQDGVRYCEYCVIAGPFLLGEAALKVNNC